MKKGLNEVVFLIDCSESMEANADKVIADFNRLLDEYKTNMSEALVTTIMFNERSKIFHDRVDIGTANPMTKEDYTLKGKTAFVDAMGLTIKHISTIQRYARDEDKPENTVFVVMTDGKDDASKRYTVDEIDKSVKRRIEKFGWQFVYTLTDLDTVVTSYIVSKATETETVSTEADDMTEYIDDLIRVLERNPAKVK